MRLHILSDLHIEFGPFDMHPADGDVMVFAGDIGTKKKGLEWIRKNFSATPVLYVFGNHEYYGAAHPKLVNEMKRAVDGTHITVLENDVHTIGDVRFLGCTLWTDFALFGKPQVAGFHATSEMNDYRRIRRSPSFSKMRSLDTALIHRQSVEWLKDQFSQTWNGPTVVITHHAPSPRSLPDAFREDLLSAAYASDLESIVEMSGAALWVHGHIHRSSDYTIGSTRVICNPRGYPAEKNADFCPSLIVEV